MSRSLSQPERFVVFALNVAAFYVLYVWATGHWALTDDPASLWFDAAVASWTLGLLSAPFFRPPKDAIGAGVAALLVLVATHLEQTKIAEDSLNTARYFAIAYALFVIASAYVAALAEKRQKSAIARLSYIAAERLDDPNIVRVQIESTDEWSEGPYVACLPGKTHKYVVPLFTQVQDDVIVGTGLITDTSPEAKLPHATGLVFRAVDETQPPPWSGNFAGPTTTRKSSVRR